MRTVPKSFAADSRHVSHVVRASAGNIGPSRHRSTITLVVLHSAETQEKTNTAENVASFFAHGSGGNKASTHYVVDVDSIIQCVDEENVAWGAKNANRNGIHVEIAGRAKQTATQWEDSYSKATLAHVTVLVGDILRRNSQIPAVILDGAAIAKLLKSGKPLAGLTTHAAVSQGSRRAGQPSSGHWDPGPGFPMSSLCKQASILGGRR